MTLKLAKNGVFGVLTFKHSRETYPPYPFSSVKNTYLALQKCITCQVATIGSILKFESKWLKSGQTSCILNLYFQKNVLLGILDAGWETLTRSGYIHLEDNLIHIYKRGTYFVYAQIYYHDNKTAHAMSHCITLGNSSDHMESVTCGMASANHHFGTTNEWMNLNTNYVSGLFNIKEDTYIGVKMNMGGDRAPHHDTILFDRKNCYFGAFQVSN